MRYFYIIALTCFFSFPVTFNLAQKLTIYGEQENLGSQINSPGYEENPVLHPSGNLLFFTRIGHPDNLGGKADQGDIWVAEKTPSGWAPAINLGRPVNSESTTSIIGFAGDGTTMYLFAERRKDGLKQNSVAISQKKGLEWSTPEPLSIQYFANSSTHSSGWVSPDARVLLLALEAPGGYGTEDIYVCFQQSDGGWSSPLNLGRRINSAYQEMTPFLAEDFKTLIFATNGIEGEGSRDLFLTERLDDTWRNWSVPVSLGSKINTPGTELSFFFHGGDDYAYLSGTHDSEGYGDIKRVRITADITPQKPDTLPQSTVSTSATATISYMPEPIIKIVGKVSEASVLGITESADTKAPLITTIKVTGQEMDNDTFSSNELGEFLINLPVNQSYTLIFSAHGYLEERRVVETFPGSHVTEIVMLQPLSAGSTIALSHLLFEQGIAAMVPGSEADLDRVVNMMRENPKVEIQISGHTDNQGPIKFNITLSEKRVATIIDYLVAHGVERKRLTGKGYGPTKPVASNASEETRKLNRRVEFTIVKGM